MVLDAGSKAPDFSLSAAVSGKTVDVASLGGRRLVLVFHGNKTQDAPKQVGKAVRADHPSPGDVLVANVVNLKAFSGLFKKVAEATLKQTYEKMASKITEHDPADLVVICADYENAVGPAFGVADSDKQAAAVVLDGTGTVLASAEGDGLVEAVLGAL